MQKESTIAAAAAAAAAGQPWLHFYHLKAGPPLSARSARRNTDTAHV